MVRRALITAAIETLEDRKLLAAVYPTAQEQYMVELLNRARANPTAEAARYTNFKDSQNNVFNGQLNEGLPAGTISTAAKQPLAINPYITDAARKHSQWMVDTDTFSHTGSGGSNPGARISAAGYTSAQTWGENIAVNWSTGTLDPTSTVFDQHRNLFTDMPIAGRGHRINMMNGSFKEIGIGVGSGLWVMSGQTWKAQTSTQDFAAKATTFLTGVAFTDAVTNDDFYTVGEGLSGITIKATRTSDNAVFTTTTWSSGGYSLALPAGTYNIQGSGTGLGNSVFYNSVTIGSTNVKRDFMTSQVTTPPQPSFAKITGRTLVVTGTAGADVISTYKSGSNYYAKLGSQTAYFSASLIDIIAIKGLAGNDKITVGAGVLKTFIEGGDGKDYIVGGAGNDTLYGNAQPDYVDGGAGDDKIVGSGGHDVLTGRDGNDTIYGYEGNDTIDCGIGNDRVYGGIGNDSIYGGDGRDFLYGEADADTINGGLHNDTSENDPLDRRISIEVLI